jgi:hypothetical protein
VSAGLQSGHRSAACRIIGHGRTAGFRAIAAGQHGQAKGAAATPVKPCGAENGPDEFLKFR